VRYGTPAAKNSIHGEIIEVNAPPQNGKPTAELHASPYYMYAPDLGGVYRGDYGSFDPPVSLPCGAPLLIQI